MTGSHATDASISTKRGKTRTDAQTFNIKNSTTQRCNRSTAKHKISMVVMLE